MPVKLEVIYVRDKFGLSHLTSLRMLTYVSYFPAQAFEIGVTTNAGEAVTGLATNAELNEHAIFPGGIVGFRLDYTQQLAAGGACT